MAFIKKSLTAEPNGKELIMQEILNFIWRFCNEDLEDLSEIQDEIYYIIAEIQDGTYSELEDEDVDLEIERRLTEKFGEQDS